MGVARLLGRFLRFVAAAAVTPLAAVARITNRIGRAPFSLLDRCGVLRTNHGRTTDP